MPEITLSHLIDSSKCLALHTVVASVCVDVCFNETDLAVLFLLFKTVSFKSNAALQYNRFPSRFIFAEGYTLNKTDIMFSP